MQNEVKLKHPIEIKTSAGNVQKVESLTVGRIKAKHLKLMPKSMLEGGEEATINVAELMPLVAGLAGIEEAEADELDFEDLVSLVAVVSGLVGKVQSPGTGSK